MGRIFETPLYPYARSRDQDAAAPARHPVVIVGAGPVGLTAALDLVSQGVPVVVLDENDRVSWGSRAICFAKRPLEILDRLGAGQRMVDKGVVWNLGKVFFKDRQVYDFNLLPEAGHRRPAFINLQQYHFEALLCERLFELRAEGAPIDLRGANKVLSVTEGPAGVELEIGTPEGPYRIVADWLIACDGAGSPVRKMMGLDFVGRVFEDNFLIADVKMDGDFPTERWFWFDPPFNPGQSALLHKQPDGVWRIDLQLGWDIDREAAVKPENVIPRLRAMLGEDVSFELEWLSVYSFQCRRMQKFRHDRVIFAGDSAHQVSPFGARGANSGVQDADNLCWKLALVVQGKAPETLLDSYDAERVQGAEENILNSTRSTDFITPKSEVSRLFRDAVLDLSESYAFARPLVNSGRLSVPCVHDGSALSTPDALPGAPVRSRPGAPCPDASLGDGFVLGQLGGGFVLLTIDAEAPDRVEAEGISARRLALSAADDATGALTARYLGQAERGVYLIRPDQIVAARWPDFDAGAVRAALLRATGREDR